MSDKLKIRYALAMLGTALLALFILNQTPYHRCVKRVLGSEPGKSEAYAEAYCAAQS